jgi:hypothetical protein
LSLTTRGEVRLIRKFSEPHHAWWGITGVISLFKAYKTPYISRVCAHHRDFMCTLAKIVSKIGQNCSKNWTCLYPQIVQKLFQKLSLFRHTDFHH